MGRHAKRTTVTWVEGEWRVDLATFDRPAVAVFEELGKALSVAQLFEKGKARMRFIEANRTFRSTADVG